MIGNIRDYYRLLEISREASGDEIRKAFRRLARQFHPDLASDKTVAEEKFKEINEAYEILGDPENRKKYDLKQGRWHRFSGFGSRHVKPKNEGFRRKQSSENFRPYTERPEFQSFYEDFFNSRKNRSRSNPSGTDSNFDNEFFRNRQHREARDGQDIEGEIAISLNEVLHGTIHTISVLRNNPLTGTTERRPLHVRIPSGVGNGQVLRLAGRGDYGIGGGNSGDLYLRVRYSENIDFRARGTNLYHDYELTPWEAIFGARKEIPTLEGPVPIKIPPGITSTRRLRLRGKGLPDGEGVRGDLFVIVSFRVRLREIARRVFNRR